MSTLESDGKCCSTSDPESILYRTHSEPGNLAGFIYQ